MLCCVSRSAARRSGTDTFDLMVPLPPSLIASLLVFPPLLSKWPTCFSLSMACILSTFNYVRYTIQGSVTCVLFYLTWDCRGKSILGSVCWKTLAVQSWIYLRMKVYMFLFQTDHKCRENREAEWERPKSLCIQLGITYITWQPQPLPINSYTVSHAEPYLVWCYMLYPPHTSCDA